jgi:hypothetical protein
MCAVNLRVQQYIVRPLCQMPSVAPVCSTTSVTLVEKSTENVAISCMISGTTNFPHFNPYSFTNIHVIEGYVEAGVQLPPSISNTHKWSIINRFLYVAHYVSLIHVRNIQYSQNSRDTLKTTTPFIAVYITDVHTAWQR